MTASIRTSMMALAMIWCCASSAQTVLLQENFDGGALPDGWTQQTLATDGGWLGGVSTDLDSQWWPITPHGSMMATNDDACDCDKSADYLITPALDLSGLDNAMLAFSSYYDGGTYEGFDEEATVEYSLDGGETWSVLQTIEGSEYLWNFEVIALDDLLGETNVHLGFRYNDGGGWLFGWAIDDVVVLEPGGLDLALIGLQAEDVVLAPATEDLAGTVVNLGVDTVYSYTVAWSMAGASGETTIDGVALGSADTHSFSFTEVLPFDLSGNYTVTAEVTAVNGMMDDQGSNNAQSVDVTAVYSGLFDNGKDLREYYYYQPTDAPENCPLVFAFHGYTGTAEGILQYSGFNDLADEFGFAVCYPQGTIDGSGEPFWNVGYAFHENEYVDDVAFVSELRGELIETYTLDAERVFGTGFSNGADFCYLLACEASDEFRAVAPIAGILMSDIQADCAPQYMVPILEVHGTDDDVSLYEGDLQNQDGWGSYPSTPDAMAFFVDLFGLTLQEAGNFPDEVTTDGSNVDYQKWGLEGACPQVWLYTVNGGGHSWPGVWGNLDIDASREAWQFFAQACSEPLSVVEPVPSGQRTLMRVTDVLGREVNPEPGVLLLFQYSDGTVEKRMTGE
ncbi:MAG: choice-of-anchor J domain-containing protein [Flavobacteriales bacterium]|nr:choice-of-anchor J domain-containing protein [Flavobacteriales bacterium]